MRRARTSDGPHDSDPTEEGTETTVDSNPSDAAVSAGAAAAAVETETTPIIPIIVDAGRWSRRSIRRFKDGRGRLSEEIEEVVTQLQEQFAQNEPNKEFVPVVVLVKERREPDDLLDGRRIGLWPFCR